jgi:hypothetical protein
VATQLSTVLTAVRDRSRAFSKQNVPDAVLARGLSDYQRRLLSLALQRDPVYLAQVATVIIANSGSSAVGTVGANTVATGTQGGFPVSVANDGTVTRDTDTAGSAKELDFADATVLVDEFVPASSTTTTATKTAAGWTVNAYAGDYLDVVAGPGTGQRRLITSNTATVLSWADALTTSLTSASVVRIVAAAESVSETVGVVTTFPTTTMKLGYLTKLDASGTAYLDLTAPLVATIDAGVPLPPFKTLVGGSVRFTADSNSSEPSSIPFAITDYAHRYEPEGQYAGYVMAGQLFLCGTSLTWGDVASIELRYVPEPPALTARTDYFLLPDNAVPALTTYAAQFAALRSESVDPAPYAAEWKDAERTYLKDVAFSQRAVSRRLRSVW